MNKREIKRLMSDLGKRSWKKRQKDPDIKEKQRLAGIAGAEKRWGTPVDK